MLSWAACLPHKGWWDVRVTVRPRSSSPVRDQVHWTKGLGGYNQFWLKLCASAHGCNTQDQAKPCEEPESGVVPHSKRSSGRFAHLGASFGPGPSARSSHASAVRGWVQAASWDASEHPARSTCMAQRSPDTSSTNMSEVGGDRDIPDQFCMLKHHGDDMTTLVLAAEGLEDPPAWVMVINSLALPSWVGRRQLCPMGNSDSWQDITGE